ncbi:MAG: DUF2207 domain-containing protein, partial [Roseibium sp.]|uniref:DUF2207 domain-containing protein n=1 Tax=Roseibium sp. TaxID=1936156 RepID=UPI0032989825
MTCCRSLRLILFAVATLLGMAGAQADERIQTFVSDIVVQQDGSLMVTETITVRAEGDQIKRGIFRDIPLRAKDADGWTHDVGFELLSVHQDGKKAQYFTKLNGDGVRIYIGDASVFLKPGTYTYAITYLMDRQVRFFSDYDEVYWNVTGNEWIFPIDEAVARISLPHSAKASEWAGYTGGYGEAGTAYVAEQEPATSRIVFTTTSPLGAYEGLTVAVAFPKGVADEPGDREKLLTWLQDQRVLVVGSIGLSVLMLYYLVTWLAVGRDLKTGVVFPRFKAPEGVSPALASYIVERGFGGTGWTALSAACLSLAAKGYLTLTKNDDVMVLQSASAFRPGSDGKLPNGEAVIEAFVSGRGGSLALDKNNGEAIKTLGAKFRSAIARENRGVYFIKNGWYLFAALVLSVVAIAALFVFGNLSDRQLERSLLFGFFSVFSTALSLGLAHLILMPFKSALGETARDVLFWIAFAAIAVGALYLISLLTALIVGDGSEIPLVPLFVLAIVVLFFFYANHIDAPTAEGRSMMSEIEGLKLYLSVAEKERLNMSGVPQMSVVHFEALLAYAVALGVEEPWAERFQHWLNSATQAAENHDYRPTWYSGRDFNGHDITRSIGATASAMAGSFQSSLPAPKSSSSGSSRGGS